MSDHSNISKLDATPGMALLDCVPVLFFWAMISLIGSLWSFPLYWVGAVLMGLAGTAKALLKVVIAFSGKDIPVLSKYFGPVMGTGFLLVLLAVLLDHRSGAIHLLWEALKSPPAPLFFLLGALGLVVMTVLRMRLDFSTRRANYIAEVTNSIAQGLFLAGMICAKTAVS